MNKLINLKKDILYCLEKYPKSRDSDIYLTQCIWAEFYREYLDRVNDQLELPLKNLDCVPSQDDIKRLRAKIQNPNLKKGYNGMFPPTSWEVAKARKWKEEDYRRILGYNPELRTV